MPVLIPMAINTGFYIEYLFRKFKDLKSKKETIPVYFNFGLIAVIGIAFPFAGYLFLKESINVNWTLFSIAALALFSIGIIIILNLKRKNIKTVFYLTIMFMVTAFILLLPLSGNLKSANYKSISSLKEKTASEGLSVYSFNYVSPEMIWQFGDKVPAIKQNDSTYNFPKAKTFGMLSNNISPKEKVLLESNYTIEHISTFDLNVAKLNSRSYKDRLISHYYILTKK